jgi:hypothetical protein
MMLLVLQSDFPLGASALPWWGWLLCAAVIAGIGWAVLAAASESPNTNDFGPHVLMVIFGLPAAFCFLVGIVRMIKWIWYS